ncbi:Fic family protein [Limosilactobacillus caecicola]|uniref:Fic family protein n=1 Tax=Limosilactobacillus caecicola TaxID=2941332 RepID=UPI00203E0ED5|nr:Fic family protein [Limosilactobacillus caecicola]
MNLTRLVFTNSRFEGINTTMPQTQTIIDGLGVDGVSIDDINTIVQLKRGWQFIINDDEKLSLEFEEKVNAIVAKFDSLDPGHLRTGNGLVNTLNGEFTPPTVSQQDETNYLQSLLVANKSTTEKAMRLMYHNMRQQIFWDGNKRTATLVANKIMIDHGAGLINVPLAKWGTWNQLISDYYDSGNVIPLLDWTYENGINGID